MLEGVEDFRQRLLDASSRVSERTGVDPLDLASSMRVTTDARLELLPQSVGIGAGLMATAVLVMCLGFELSGGGPGFGLTVLFVLVALLLLGATAACVLVARLARTRRPENDRFEDAWARLAVEVWPAPRLQSWAATSAPDYSRTEFLMAVRDGADLTRFSRHAPFTRMA